MANTEYTHTLYRQDTNAKIPETMAWVSAKFDEANLGAWRAHIQATKQGQTFSTLQQAKDWAQAVVLLTQ